MEQPYVTSSTIEGKAQHWLEKIAPFNQHPMQLAKDKSALLVIDMQRFFLDSDSPTFICGGLAILPDLQRLIAAFREAGRPVIYNGHVHHPEGLDAGITAPWSFASEPGRRGPVERGRLSRMAANIYNGGESIRRMLFRRNGENPEAFERRIRP